MIGASTGIGRATASLLHARGARVIVSARSAQALTAFVASHGAAAGQVAAEALPLDVTDAAAWEAAFARLASTRLDLVCYCAGYYKEMRAQAFDLDDALQHQKVNYEGVLLMLKHLLPKLQAQALLAGAGDPTRGQLSLVSSVAGYGGLPKSLAYGPTKAALTNLAEALYIDLRDDGIGVNVVCPGFVETPLTAQNKFTMPALQTPEQAAQAIVNGWERGEFEIHFPKRFTRFLKGLQHLGYSAYFPLVKRATGL
jgi:NAD(P)-dependent dehydrogenase (short-subunit alcohol dehydrogenase family)